MKVKAHKTKPKHQPLPNTYTKPQNSTQGEKKKKTPQPFITSKNLQNKKTTHSSEIK